MFALPDLKLGWIAISGPRAHQYLDGLELLNDTLLGANALTQAMLPTLFERGQDFASTMRAQVQSNLLVALTHLHNIDCVRVAPPKVLASCEDNHLYGGNLWAKWSRSRVTARRRRGTLRFHHPGGVKASWSFRSGGGWCRTSKTWPIASPRPGSWRWRRTSITG